MRRHAIIISNPGTAGTDDYLRGVPIDVQNYKSFLTGPTGGLRQPSEVEEMRCPRAYDIRRKMDSLLAQDYVFIVFTGHGWHSDDLDSTILQLCDGQEIDSAELRLAATKQTLILDCCRKRSKGPPLTEARDAMKFAKSGPTINPSECRKYYDKRIEDCPIGQVIMYSCGIDELSNEDDQRGGFYSYYLLEASREWVRNSTTDTSGDYSIRSVASAHDAAVPLVERRGLGQTPHIEKPRTAPYYPFCIVA
jgi:hypothetical protein